MAKTNDETSIMGLAALMGHDLKAPVRQVKQWSEYVREMLEDHLASLPSDVAQNVSTGLVQIDQGASSIHRMIGRLMDLAQWMSEPSDEVGDPELSLDQAVDELVEEGTWTERVHLARFFKSGEPPMVAIPKSGLLSLWKNLLTNAINSDPVKELRVAVGMIEMHGALIVYVSDNGGGIVEDHQPWLFDFFFKGNPESEGTGAGLAICKMVIERFGGSISLIRSKIGSGSVFKLEIPLVQKVKS